MARAATQLGVRAVCSGAKMSPRTLGLIEAADKIEYGVKEAGRFEAATIEKLVRLYQRQGVRFLPPSPLGPGIRHSGGKSEDRRAKI